MHWIPYLVLGVCLWLWPLLVVAETAPPYVVLNVSLPEIFPDMGKIPLNKYRPASKSNHKLGHLDQLLLAKVKTSEIDFILYFTLQEVPGWIHSGAVNRPAQNIGFANASYNNPHNPAWPRLKAHVLMNDVSFLFTPRSQLRNYNSTLTVCHEIGHYWGVQWSHTPNIGPRKWRPGQSIVPLGTASAHWTWTWLPIGKIIMPGILYSGPTSPYFNAFDLYAMGLMSYEESSRFTYWVHPPDQPKQAYPLRLADLIHSVKQKGPDYYRGNGRRIPLQEPNKNFKTLLVVIKEPRQQISRAQDLALRQLVQDLPADWYLATWKRSQMSVYQP